MLRGKRELHLGFFCFFLKKKNRALSPSHPKLVLLATLALLLSNNFFITKHFQRFSAFPACLNIVKLITACRPDVVENSQLPFPRSSMPINAQTGNLPRSLVAVLPPPKLALRERGRGGDVRSDKLIPLCFLGLLFACSSLS